MGNTTATNSDATNSDIEQQKQTIPPPKTTDSSIAAEPPAIFPNEATSLLGRLNKFNPFATKPPAASTKQPTSWIKMPIGQNALDDAAEAVNQASYNPCPCLEMTYSQRFIAFAICFAIGTVLSIISTMNVPSIVLAPARFAVPFTLGNIISLLSMSFLVGCKRQFQSIFHPDRVVTSSVFVASMIGTLVAAFIVKSALMCFFFVIIQYGSYIWYCASFIPYGRSFLLGCGKRCYACLT